MKFERPIRTNFAADAEGEIKFADAAVEYMRLCREDALAQIAEIDNANSRTKGARLTPQDHMRMYKRAARMQGETLHDVLQKNPLLRDLHKRGLLFKRTN